MQPRDRLTAKEIQVATLVWQGLTNKDIAKVLITSEQVVKNYLRTAFDKLGVWTRLELALYVASHGGANWHVRLGNGLLPQRRGGASAWARKVLLTRMRKPRRLRRLEGLARNCASGDLHASSRRERQQISHGSLYSGVPTSRWLRGPAGPK